MSRIAGVRIIIRPCKRSHQDSRTDSVRALVEGLGSLV